MDGSTLTTILFLGGFVLLHVFMHSGHGGHGGHGGGGCCGGHGHGHGGHDHVGRAGHDIPEDDGDTARHSHAHDDARVGRHGSGDRRNRRDDGGWG